MFQENNQEHEGNPISQIPKIDPYSKERTGIILSLSKVRDNSGSGKCWKVKSHHLRNNKQIKLNNKKKRSLDKDRN